MVLIGFIPSYLCSKFLSFCALSYIERFSTKETSRLIGLRAALFHFELLHCLLGLLSIGFESFGKTPFTANEMCTTFFKEMNL